MKKPAGVEDMAARLRNAATTPALTIVHPTPTETAPEASSTSRRVKGAGASMSVFLRVPPVKHAELEAEAVRRTKETGKGVTVQQIILERI